MKSKKLRIISIISVIVILISLILIWELGVFRLQRKEGEAWLSYRSDKLTYVGNTLFWSVDTCEPVGVVYDTGVFTSAYGNDKKAVYYWYPLFGGKKTGPAGVYVSEKIDCDVRNNIFNSMSLTCKSEESFRYNLDSPINAYTFCIPYSGSEISPKMLNHVGTISLNHMEIEWLHWDYVVYCDAEKYYCYKMNGVYEEGEQNEGKKWFLITDEALIEWFSSR